MGQILGCKIPGVKPVTSARAEALKERMDGLGLLYPSDAPETLVRYHALLEEWNKNINLTGDADFELSLDRHYADSLAPLAVDGLFPEGARLIDVGSGAGFPGIPLAVVRPDMRITLLDSLMKRVGFLNAVKDGLALGNVLTLHSRAEDAARAIGMRESFDIAVARAVAPLNVLCELLLPFVRVGGKMLCYKGPAASEELEACSKAALMLGGGKPIVIPVSLPSQPEWRHMVVCVTKEKKTVRQYPRKAGVASRSPLGAPDGK